MLNVGAGQQHERPAAVVARSHSEAEVFYVASVRVGLGTGVQTCLYEYEDAEGRNATIKKEDVKQIMEL